ncbi:MAG TPA: endonuclease [Chitinophagaceae bacterium]|nr:endonuclease [Chitinophagaceae bacterium]
MKKTFFLLLLLCIFSSSHAQEKDWRLGIQMWTFHISNFHDALYRVDSTGLTTIEVYPGQKLGGGLLGVFGPTMDATQRKTVRDWLTKHQIKVHAFGVVVCDKPEEWDAYFAFAKEMSIPIITAEPAKAHLDIVNELAGKYGIKVAIHDHPKPSLYWHPDSVLAAASGRPNIGACADIGHWVRNGLDPVDCLKKLEGKVYGLHVKDVAEFGNPKADDVVFGNGKSNIAGVLKELKRQRFKGFFSIEHEANWITNVHDVIADAQYFQQQLKQLK